MTGTVHEDNATDSTDSVLDRDLGRHADAPELDEHGNPWPTV